MSHELFLRFPIEVTLALLALVLILTAVARVLLALRKPVPVRIPGCCGEAPYKLEPPELPRHGQLDAVAQAGREPANR
jgi:hypothetical protein